MRCFIKYRKPSGRHQQVGTVATVTSWHTVMMKQSAAWTDHMLAFKALVSTVGEVAESSSFTFKKAKSKQHETPRPGRKEERRKVGNYFHQQLKTTSTKGQGRDGKKCCSSCCWCPPLQIYIYICNTYMLTNMYLMHKRTPYNHYRDETLQHHGQRFQPIAAEAHFLYLQFFRL